MQDVTTKQPLYVSTDGTAGPYIMVPVTQLNFLGTARMVLVIL